MKQDNNGDYLIELKTNSNIDYYIASFSGLNEMLKSLLRKDPDTRAAILGASYQDILTLRVLASDAAAYLRELQNRKILQATGEEMREAADTNPHR